MKKTVLLVLCFVMAALMLSANGNQDGSTSADEVTNLVWYGYATAKKDHDMVMDHLSDYLEEKINVRVETVFLAGKEYATRVPIVMISGQQMDVCFTSSWTNSFVQNVGKENFIPLDDLLDQHGHEVKAVIPERIWDLASMKGQIYGVPIYKDFGQAAILEFDMERMEKYNLDIDDVSALQGIDTLRSLEPFLMKLKEEEPKTTGIAFNALQVGNNFIDNIVSVSGIRELPGSIRLDGDTTKIVNEWETPEYRELVTLLHDWYRKGYIHPDASIRDDGLKPETTAGKTFIIPHTGPGIYEDYEWSTLYDRPYEMVLAKPMTVTGLPVMHAIPTVSQFPEKAMEFINLLGTDPMVARTVIWGVEGVHYENEDNVYAKSLFPDLNSADRPYELRRKWSTINQTVNLLSQGVPADKNQKLIAANGAMVVPESVGFVFDVEPVKNEVAACTNVSKEYRNELLTGTLDPSIYLQETIDKYNANGLQKILAVMQSQYDDFLAAK